jgi:hypothetical protein
MPLTHCRIGERIESRYHFGNSVGSMAHHSLPSSSLHSNLGGRTMCDFGRATSSYCLDLQQYQYENVEKSDI